MKLEQNLGTLFFKIENLRTKSKSDENLGTKYDFFLKKGKKGKGIKGGDQCTLATLSSSDHSSTYPLGTIVRRSLDDRKPKALSQTQLSHSLI